MGKFCYVVWARDPPDQGSQAVTSLGILLNVGVFIRQQGRQGSLKSSPLALSFVLSVSSRVVLDPAGFSLSH